THRRGSFDQGNGRASADPHPPPPTTFRRIPAGARWRATCAPRGRVRLSGTPCSPDGVRRPPNRCVAAAQVGTTSLAAALSIPFVSLSFPAQVVRPALTLSQQQGVVMNTLRDYDWVVLAEKVGITLVILLVTWLLARLVKLALTKLVGNVG